MEEKFTAKNNIDIFCYPNHNTHSFCLSLYIKAGALYEGDGENGITHFLEHIFFRNINRLMGGNMYKELDKLGLCFNGATYKEFVQLYITGSPRRFRAALDIMLRTFEPIALPAKEIGTERQRVKAEIREADEMKTLDYFTGTYVWKGTALSRTIAGKRGDINRFTGKKTEDYRKKIFTYDNLFFYITGNVSRNDMEYAKMRIGDKELRNESLCRRNCAPVPEAFGKRGPEIAVKSGKEAAVQFSYDFVTEKYVSAELSLLYDILFSGENSLIHQELSEKRGLIYSYTSTLEKYRNIGRICFGYEVEAKDLYLSVEIVKCGLGRLTGDIGERLSMVLPEYTDNAYMLYDDNEDFNWNRAYENHIMDDRTSGIEEDIAAFKGVKAERIEAMAKEIFTGGNLVFTAKGDVKQIDKERIRNILSGDF